MDNKKQLKEPLYKVKYKIKKRNYLKNRIN